MGLPARTVAGNGMPGSIGLTVPAKTTVTELATASVTIGPSKRNNSNANWSSSGCLILITSLSFRRSEHAAAFIAAIVPECLPCLRVAARFDDNKLRDTRKDNQNAMLTERNDRQ
jgi:hypothetical protein